MIDEIKKEIDNKICECEYRKTNYNLDSLRGSKSYINNKYQRVKIETYSEVLKILDKYKDIDTTKNAKEHWFRGFGFDEWQLHCEDILKLDAYAKIWNELKRYLEQDEEAIIKTNFGIFNIMLELERQYLRGGK